MKTSPPAKFAAAELDPAGRLLVAASPLQRWLARLAFPLVVLVPGWFGLGRLLLPGGGGWATLMLMSLALIGLAVILLHAVLTTLHASRVRPFAAGRGASRATLVVCLLVAVIPFWVEDHADYPPASPAPVTRWFGVPAEVAGPVLLGLMVLLFLAVGAMLLLDVIELDEVSRARQERQAAAQRDSAVDHLPTEEPGSQIGSTRPVDQDAGQDASPPGPSDE